VIRKGEPSTFVAIVLEGDLTVRRGGADADACSEGSYLGEMDYFGHAGANGKRRQEEVVADTDCVLLLCPFKDIHNARETPIGFKLIESLAEAAFAKLIPMSKQYRAIKESKTPPQNYAKYFQVVQNFLVYDKGTRREIEEFKKRAKITAVDHFNALGVLGFDGMYVCICVCMGVCVCVCVLVRVIKRLKKTELYCTTPPTHPFIVYTH
jgi:hypothetical protein